MLTFHLLFMLMKTLGYLLQQVNNFSFCDRLLIKSRHLLLLFPLKVSAHGITFLLLQLQLILHHLHDGAKLCFTHLGEQEIDKFIGERFHGCPNDCFVQ